MKNLIVKTGALFILAIILTVVSVQAQSTSSYRAQIPFDFTIKNKLYKSGDYVISVKGASILQAVLTVKNIKTRDSRQLAVWTNGSRSKMEKTILMFDRYGDQYVLKQVISPDFGLTAPRSKIRNRIAKKIRQPDQTVAIILLKRNDEKTN